MTIAHRLMVGHLALDQGVEVRIFVGEHEIFNRSAFHDATFLVVDGRDRLHSVV